MAILRVITPADCSLLLMHPGAASVAPACARRASWDAARRNYPLAATGPGRLACRATGQAPGRSDDQSGKIIAAVATRDRRRWQRVALLMASRSVVYPAGAGADGSFCQRPNSFPCGSLHVTNQPMPGTGPGSSASPPSSLTRRAPALMSSTSK
jgi:hypothetical protein